MINKNYKKATRIAAITGRIIGYLFVAVGVFIIIYFGWWVNGMWFAFIGWFLSSAAAGSYRQLEIRDSLGGITAGDVMIRDYLSIAPSLTLRQLHVYVMHTGQLFFLVTEKGSLMGSVSADSFKTVPEQMWDVTTARQVMTPAEQMQLIQIDDDAIGILEKMDDVGTSRAVVVDRNNGILGLITRDNMLRFAQVRSELGT
jgi:CBS-domain-containing membrane protein